MTLIDIGYPILTDSRGHPIVRFVVPRVDAIRWALTRTRGTHGRMSLLVLDGVSQRVARNGRGRAERVCLRDVSLEIAAAELVAVWGRRRSGRSTLLRVAAGLEPPDAGAVRFDGVVLERRAMLGQPGGIGYCTTLYAGAIGASVVEHVAAPLLAGDISVLHAEALALETLRRVDAHTCAALMPHELDAVELIRVSIARALVTGPRLLLLDEPTRGVPPARERDALLAFVRSLVEREGIAVLMTVNEASELAGADRALTIDAGELRGEVVGASAPVVPLRRVRLHPA
jgi:ABC-type sulfate/molybdate transport systems ATPase subunit